MKIPKITKQFIQSELYKVCDGYDTSRIVGKYSSKSTWQPHDVIRRLVQVCLERTSLEDICLTSSGPSADTVHKRCAELKFEQTERLVNGWLIEIVSRLKFHPKTKITLAFDLYNQLYYGNSSHSWVVGKKRKKGTNYAISYLVVTIASQNIRCPIAVRLMTKERLSRNADLVSEILDELFVWLPMRRVLFDRGFCQESIIQVAEDRNLEYVIAAIRHSRIKQAAQTIQETVQTLAHQAGINTTNSLALGRWLRQKGLDTYRVEYVSTGKRRKPVPLVAAFVRQRTYYKNPYRRVSYCLFLYLTNTTVSPRTVVRLYSKRWIVETDIRCTNEFKAVTNSTKPQLRMLLYGLAMVFNALWIIYSTLIQRLKEGKIFKGYPESLVTVKQMDELVCIARWFLRFVRQEILPQLHFQGGDA